MSVENEMKKRLEKNLSPNFLEIKNQSHLHAGHAGDDGSGESHFLVKISSSQFEGVNRVNQERLVHKALGEIMSQIHALSVKIIEN
ncbi:MAG: BolA family protein [Pseudomonadota bacterium]